jgi:APA family basic amino acid/polyamine antiporter
MIGLGTATITGVLAGDLGTPGLVLWIWVAGALCALLGAICYSELGINFPSSGGEYIYITRAFGPTWGFVAGWVSFFVGFSAPTAVAALAFTQYLTYFFPATKENSFIFLGSGEWALLLGPAQLAAATLVALFSVLNVLGVRHVAAIQNVLTAAQVVVLLAGIVLLFVTGQGSMEHFSMNAVRTSQTPMTTQFAVSLVVVYVMYSGWNIVTYMAAELRRPWRTLPLAMVIGTLIVTALYLALNVALIYNSPLEDLKNSPNAALFGVIGVKGSGFYFAFAAVSLMSAVNARMAVGPRLCYAMAGNGAFASIVAKVDARFHTPVIAILAQGVCAILMILTTLWMTVATFEALLVYTGFTLNLLAVMSVVALLKFRRRLGWQKLSVVSFLYPLIPTLFVVVSLWFTVQGVRMRPFAALAVVVTAITGALVYHFLLKSRLPRLP